LRTSASAKASESPTSKTQHSRTGNPPAFDELQRAALAFTDEIVKLRRPTDATFNAIAAKLTPAALIELQLSVGFYIMTSKFLKTFGIDMQPVSEVV
jgi:alkylhydroperoxidase family enzyme